MNKDIKRIKKLYQAAVCWGDPNNFHTKCYNIPNSLTVIKTENNRRFGRFTSSTWETNNTGEFKKDKKAFIFSLDNKKYIMLKIIIIQYIIIKNIDLALELAMIFQLEVI